MLRAQDNTSTLEVKVVLDMVVEFLKIITVVLMTQLEPYQVISTSGCAVPWGWMCCRDLRSVLHVTENGEH